MKELPDFRFRLTDVLNNVSYLLIGTYNNRRVVTYKSASEVPLALSNMFPEDAAGVRIKLQDAGSIGEAKRVIEAERHYFKKLEVV